MTKDKILIVEDEPNMRKTLTSILQQEGYISYEAERGKEISGLKMAIIYAIIQYGRLS